MNLKHPALVWGAVVLGVALIALAVLYWVEPASSLPSFIPGHEAGSSHHHVKHGIGSFFVGVALLVYAWFQTGGDKRKELPAP
jgi:hypothetical protein